MKAGGAVRHMLKIAITANGPIFCGIATGLRINIAVMTTMATAVKARKGTREK